MYQHSTTLTTKSGFQGTKKYNKLYEKIYSAAQFDGINFCPRVVTPLLIISKS